MSPVATNQRTSLEKIRSLPAHKVAEVGNLVDFLRHRNDDRRLGKAAALLSEPTFARIWGNTDDAAYDAL